LKRGVQTHSEHVPDELSVEHSVGVASNEDEEADVDEFSEAAHIPRHIEKGVNDSLVLYHAISQPELALKVGCGVDRAQIHITDALNRDEVVLRRLVLIPDLKM